jgi:peptide chain release factor subunit 1
MSDDKFGFVVMDGTGTLFGTLSGNVREVLHKVTVDLPKKHGRGGQSALRFARLRVEKRHNYVRKIAEVCTQLFITNDRPNVTGIVLAGLADFKSELNTTLLDPRLQSIVLKIVDVSYGGESGFNQAIELSAEVLGNVKFVREKKLIGAFMEEIAVDSGRFVFGVAESLKALEIGAIETLIAWENLEHVRYVLKNSSTGEEVIKVLNKTQQADTNQFRDAASGADLEIQESMALLEWLASSYKQKGARLEIVTDRSAEGNQFVKGFGGLGGILRYKLELEEVNPEEGDDLDIDSFL